MAGVEDEQGSKPAPDDIVAEAEAAPDLTAAAVEVIPPEIVAQSLGQYLKAWSVRVRGGDAGILPVVGALLAVTIVFQIMSPKGVFLSPGNLVNLFIQSCVFIVLAMAESFALLLGEIDLSIGYVAAIGGIVAALFVQSPGPSFGLSIGPFNGQVWPFNGQVWPWWAAIIAALLVCAAIGALHGFIITRLRVPAFIVTLAGYLAWFGVMILILGPSGGVNISSALLNDQHILFQLVWGNIDPVIGWIALAVMVGLLGGWMWFGDAGRRRSGLVAPPPGLTAAKIAFVAAAGIAVVAICNVNRGLQLPVEGVPWAVPIVLFVLAVWTVLLERTEFGRHMYAVGGNAEAARRAGINVSGIRTMAFVLCSFTAGIAGLLYSSQQGGMNTNINGGQLVLYAVAAAVIGGTSLFGGRGRAIHGVLGGLTIGAIYNGLYLLGFEVQWQLIATGLVLLAAVTIDALSRRGAGSVSAAHA
ncbi:MAG: ABC transporter permease [Candidatus Limnocylindrales bacterium]|jgi:D-xylose transport system permease protein